jgi:hypothetical protein
VAPLTEDQPIGRQGRYSRRHPASGSATWIGRLGGRWPLRRAT